MYLNLTIRNARRSLKDYLIYTVTLTVLITIICLSNIVSTISAQSGLSGSSLPALIVIIATCMLDYMNQFFLKQRGKELATYSLLGMNKDRISSLVSGELILLGIVCLAIGTFLGGILFALFSLLTNPDLAISVSVLPILGQNTAYLLLIELLTSFLLRRRIKKVQLSKLVELKAHHDKRGKRSVLFLKKCLAFNSVLTISLLVLTLLDVQGLGFSLSSVISLPLIFNIYLFYKTIFSWLSEYRAPENSQLYARNRLIRISKLLSNHRSSTILYTILCLCLFFSFCSLAFANVLDANLMPSFDLNDYMIFLQRVLSFIFIFLYFCLLSLLQMVDSYQTKNDFRILHYLGKDTQALKKFALTDIATRFLLPVSFFAILIVLVMSILLFSSLPVAVIKSLFVSIGLYFVIFAILGASFTWITYRLNVKMIDEVIQP